jgi:thioredoxin 2
MTESLHLVCPSCNAVNRLPSTKLAEHPVCGNCRQPHFSGHPVELNSGNLARHLQRNDIPILVDFWAPWCGPCKTMAPQFAKAAGTLEPRFRLAKINTEAEPELGGQFGIRSIPTLVLFRAGREVARQSGVMGAQDIIRWAESQR